MCRLKQVPPKVQAFSWKLVQDRGRLPTFVNLYARGVLSQENSLCFLSKQVLETEDHLFFGCNVAINSWYHCLDWWGLSSALHSNGRRHYDQFIGLLCRKSENLLASGVVLNTVWAIWLARNYLAFNSVDFDVAKVMEYHPQNLEVAFSERKEFLISL